MGVHGQRLTDAELGYLAGYMDADGCVYFSSGTARLEVCGAFPWALQMFHDSFGGALTQRVSNAYKGGRPHYRWTIHGKKAQWVIRTLRPFMREKGAQADLVLSICKTKPGTEREGLLAQLKALKHAHYNHG